MGAGGGERPGRAGGSGAVSPPSGGAAHGGGAAPRFSSIERVLNARRQRLGEAKGRSAARCGGLGEGNRANGAVWADGGTEAGREASGGAEPSSACEAAGPPPDGGVGASSAEAGAVAVLQAHARGFLARCELRRRQCDDLRALWDSRALTACLVGWAAAATRRRTMRERVLDLRLAYGKWAHRYLARSFDGAPIFSAEGKNAMADAFCRWRRAIRALFLWFEAASARPPAAAASERHRIASINEPA